MAVVIYNCKRCKSGRRVEYHEVEQRSLGCGRSEKRHFRRTELGARVQPGQDYDRDGTPRGDAVCAGCGRFMAWGYLNAHRDEAIRCDARCTNARGFKCDCSCGGEHHGAGWGFTTLIAASDKTAAWPVE